MAEDEELVDHLVRSGVLRRGEAVRVVAEVVAYFSETAEEFVRRRHRELREGGSRTRRASRGSRRSCGRGPWPRRALSERQVRRIIYG